MQRKRQTKDCERTGEKIQIAYRKKGRMETEEEEEEEEEEDAIFSLTTTLAGR